jgi:hypothetical protein
MSDIIEIEDQTPEVIEIITPGAQGPAGSGGGLPAGFDIEAISDTRIRLKYTGSDDVERSVALTIS